MHPNLQIYILQCFR